MIEFSCPSCQKPFSVPDHLAGRQARCKSCGGVMTIPGNSWPVAHGPWSENQAADSSRITDHGPRTTALSPRLRRLASDYDQMQRAFKNFDLIHLTAAHGDPPELYRIDYEIAGLEAGEDNHPVSRDHHRVEIQLPADYPRVAPLCRMLTPAFHPNIAPSHICVADHWTAGERLVDLVVRIGEIIAYQAYNIKSPLDAVAARWTDFNAARLPIDPRPIRPPES